jgi:PHD/YefM family antitoxin component YafN of YafNO toxin-antitoxin module
MAREWNFEQVNITDEQFREQAADVIDNASDQDKMTWITDRRGKRVAAVVTAEDAERIEQDLDLRLRGLRW